MKSTEVKANYRDYFASCQKYVKMSAILREVGIPKQTFSKFMKSEELDFMLSVEKLKIINDKILEVLDRLT